ncbi:hypothetical protein [Sphingomonas sp. 3-13AW]|uniref:hypothetical protein n=1 Tax=Sphingomonas sp. 3-13AW TaxID=3050450 RepID=UPI003BB8079A
MDAPSQLEAKTGHAPSIFQDNPGRRKDVIRTNPTSRFRRCGRSDGSRDSLARKGVKRSGMPSGATQNNDRNGESMDKMLDLDIDALLFGSGPIPEAGINDDLPGLLDRQIAREVAQSTRVTTLLIMGKLAGPKCLPSHCDDLCPSFKLISMRKVGAVQIAMFSVPVESEMAVLFEKIDNRRDIQAIAYDAQGRAKEAYVL